MNVVAERFIELSVAEKYRRLSRSERFEKRECLKYLEERQWKIDKLKMLSYLASETNDTDWQHEICNDLEKVER